jgi:hypothetical protein
MLHDQVGSRAPPSKRDRPASTNSPRTGVRWLASLVATLPLVAEVVLFRLDPKATAEFAALADRPTTIESFAVSGGR